MNSVINSTTNILNRTEVIASIEKIFRDIGLNFEPYTILKSSEETILRIVPGLLTNGDAPALLMPILLEIRRVVPAWPVWRL